MPALPAAAQVLKIAFTFDNGSDANMVCRFFVKYGGTAPTSAQLATMAAALMTSWGSTMNASVSSSVSLTGVEITDLTSATAAQGSASGTQTGTRSGQNLPAGTAAVWTLSIARRYRGGKPKVFWPLGTANDITTGQHWVSSVATAFETALVAFIAALEGDFWSGGSYTSLVNVSYYSGFTNRTGSTGREKAYATVRAAAVIDTITATAVKPQIGTQRRRTLVR